MDSARHEAGIAFLVGQKRVEVVQAYYLLSLYPTPARRWEETRAWLNVFNLDRSLGSQYGKMSIICNADYVASHSHEWWNSSEYNMENFDVHLCAYNAELRVLSDFMMKVYSNPEHPTGLNKVGVNRVTTRVT